MQRVHCHLGKCDVDSTPESFSDTKHLHDYNVDLDNLTLSIDNR
jgi:hypothetical protein